MMNAQGTPKSIRMRKIYLNENNSKKNEKKAEVMSNFHIKNNKSQMHIHKMNMHFFI